MANPKKDKTLYVRSLDTAPACSTEGSQVEDQMEFLSVPRNAENGGGMVWDSDVSEILEGLQRYFEEKDNCSENFSFTTQGQFALSMYMEEKIGKATAGYVLKGFGELLAKYTPQRAVIQLCGNGTFEDDVIGISFDTTGDLTAVQRFAWEWSRGLCVCDADLKESDALEGIKILRLDRVVLV